MDVFRSGCICSPPNINIWIGMREKKAFYISYIVFIQVEFVLNIIFCIKVKNRSTNRKIIYSLYKKLNSQSDLKSIEL